MCMNDSQLSDNKHLYFATRENIQVSIRQDSFLQNVDYFKKENTEIVNIYFNKCS